MRFATRVLLLQLALVAAVVAMCTTVFLVLGVQQLRAESESSALNIARTVAEDPDVRALVAEISADPGSPDPDELKDGPLQELSTAVAARTDALFVVIADDHGIRLAHPNEALLGEVVSTPFADVLAGNEVVDWERGTLGESARAKVPILPFGGGAPVGEVSVGFERASVFDDLPVLIATIAVAALGAFALAALATFVMRRRWERLTLGLQPEELVSLVQNQAAVLDGVGDGVVALDPRGVVRVCNTAAERMLGLAAPIGRTLVEAGATASVVAAISAGGARDGMVVGDRVLYLDSHPVQRDGRSLGDVVIVRDRTDLVALSERLDTVRAMTGALRVQRHEFANRLHVATGLIDADRPADARAFLAEQLERGAVDFPVAGLGRVTDPFLQSFLGAKSLELGERGVALTVGEGTLVLGTLTQVEDVAAILGNLLDNAATAAARAGAPARVETTFLTDVDQLVMTVADSGHGIAAGVDVFTTTGRENLPADALHGLGIGLPLSRELARRRGGDVWIIDPGGRGAGAVFGARVPGVVVPQHPSSREETP
ncbi:sensor histidine kinase [Microbacterium terricola]|uniref:Sensor-like histidine kinase SenX3 n=1 Tax=Microbacterium terricola TaxID=344163 RepID=A0ABM8E009_9MICO|nr:ATP-binding protein [Microbacterium terricola]UYK41076.1 ATP-binding protein [Microbacterium terricola]BDV31165.1 histidine kinase [Microbacterium terricola]